MTDFQFDFWYEPAVEEPEEIKLRVTASLDEYGMAEDIKAFDGTGAPVNLSLKDSHGRRLDDLVREAAIDPAAKAREGQGYQTDEEYLWQAETTWR